MKALVFGEIIWDVFDTEKTIGGAPYNFAANLAHLGDEALLFSAVGGDDKGRAAFDEAARHRVDRSLIQINGYETGKCLVTLENGLPRYNVLSDVAYDHITAGPQTLAMIRAAAPDALYFGTLCQRGPSAAALNTVLENCAFSEIFCDINVREGCSDRESVRRCLENATLLKVSDEEAHFIADYGLVPGTEEPLASRLCRVYPQIRQVLYTMGADGSRVYDAASGKTFDSGRPAPVQVVSTVGAGDCYGATYFHCYMQGRSIPECIASATERSSVVVSSRGALPF